MGLELLTDILIIFTLSIFVLIFCHKIKIPTVVGFLATGIIAGPHGFGLISASDVVETLSEIGVILLLFTIGIEFSLKSLWQIKKGILLGGHLQVLLAILGSFIICSSIGLKIGPSIFIGFLISLSSTAIVLKVLQESSAMESPHGKISLAILIFQDIIVVPMMLFTPLLSGEQENIGVSFISDLASGLLIIFLVLLSARTIVPKLLDFVAKTRDRELFLLTIVVICLAVAWLTSKAGLSLALGAFLAGLIISESEYSQQALGNIIPFKDVFTSLFFVSIGMLLDTSLFLTDANIIILTTIGVMVLKIAVGSTASALLGFPFRTNILVGLALCQVGEFSFILSKVGLEHELITNYMYQVFLAVSILSMTITPIIIQYAPMTFNFVTSIPLPEWFKKGFQSTTSFDTIKDEKLNDHVIIIGYGLNGRCIASACKKLDIPYAIIDSNPETVKRESRKGQRIYFGDATQKTVLKKAHLNEAKMVVVATSDLFATNIITKTIRDLNPLVHIIVRTRFAEQTKIFSLLGANEVVSDEVESTLEILSKVLNKFYIDIEQIQEFKSEIIDKGYNI